MSLAFAIQRSEHGNAVKIRYGIMFDFYPGLPHMQKASCAKQSLATIVDWGRRLVIDYNSYLTVLSLIPRLFIGLGTRLDVLEQ